MLTTRSFQLGVLGFDSNGNMGVEVEVIDPFRLPRRGITAAACGPTSPAERRRERRRSTFGCRWLSSTSECDRCMGWRVSAAESSFWSMRARCANSSDAAPSPT
eukprot:906006-Prymnesium_polylepis.1